MVKEGIVLGHKISKKGIEVDKAKIDVIAKLPHPTTVKGIRSFLGHAGFYRRFIKDFSKISRPMTHLLEKNTPFIFSEECIQAFQTLKKKLTEAPILIAPDWDQPFELMCDASDYAIEGTSSERLSEAHPTPSPEPTSEAPNESLHDSSSAQSSEVPFEQQPDLSPSPSPRPSPNPSPTPNIPDSIPEHTGENLGDHSFNDTSLSGNEDAMTLQNVYDLCISLCKQVSDQAKEIKLLKAKITKLKKKANPVIKHFKAYQKRISKEQRQQRKRLSKKKKVQIESVSKQGRKNAKGDGKAKENAQSEGRTKEYDGYVDKEMYQVGLHTEDEVISTDDQVDASEDNFKGTEDKGEGSEERVESTTEQRQRERMKIDEEDETESEDDDIPQAVKKFKQTWSDEELARKVQEEWDAEEEKKPNLTEFLAEKLQRARKRNKEEVQDENKDEESTRKETQDEEKEVDYEVLDRKYPIIDWKTVCLGTKPQFDESKEGEINLNVVTRSNGQQRYFSVLTTVLSIFDREDLNAVFQLVLFKPDEQDEFWSSQHEWKVISWKLHSSSGVHTLMTNEGVVIHMLTEKKYPLKKEIVVQMLNLRLESEEESTMALELIRFIKKVLADLESKEQD
ncbi:reverse transcriptase domain-containing protein [Tanacetum coccineum]